MEFKLASRNLDAESTTIHESLCVAFTEGDGGRHGVMWHLPPLAGYVCAIQPLELVDFAYSQIDGSLYAMFKDDGYVYRYEDPSSLKDAQRRIVLKKEDADQKIETKHTTFITTSHMEHTHIFLDHLKTGGWEISIYGSIGGAYDLEKWRGSPSTHDFTTYNDILFGDSMFTEPQLKF